MKIKANKNRVELLTPAGNFEKLEIAIHYGADAVYLGDQNFSLRNFADNFTPEQLKQAVDFAHKNSTKAYIACNIYAKNSHQNLITEYLKYIGSIEPDAIIISDPGILLEAQTIIPQIPIHLSTQANTCNYRSAIFWKNQGIKRINTARELSLKEIEEIIQKTSIEVETFVHGAMCISYSGRCLLSSFMTQRDSNRGMCSHPCRWQYYLMEEQRPGEYLPVFEDKHGTYIFNSKDLCMIEHIPELIESGITSLKIEGRMKSINYLSTVTKVYKEAIDMYYNYPENYSIKKEWLQDLASISNRFYCSGFYFQNPDEIAANINNKKPVYTKQFVGKVLKKIASKTVLISVRNKIFQEDIVEVLCKKGPAKMDKINKIYNHNNQILPFAQPNSEVIIVFDRDYSPNNIIRKINQV